MVHGAAFGLSPLFPHLLRHLDRGAGRRLQAHPKGLRRAALSTRETKSVRRLLAFRRVRRSMRGGRRCIAAPRPLRFAALAFAGLVAAAAPATAATSAPVLKASRSQSGADVRVLIIDDASSDCTPSVARELAAADPRVTFRRHTVNVGSHRHLQRGLPVGDGHLHGVDLCRRHAHAGVTAAGVRASRRSPRSGLRLRTRPRLRR